MRIDLSNAAITSNPEQEHVPGDVVSEPIAKFLLLVRPDVENFNEADEDEVDLG